MSSLLECPANYMLENAARLFLSEVVRALPGRRLVCRGEYAGAAVYAKLFFGSKGQRDARRDAEGSRALTAAGIATPELVYCGRLADRPVDVVIYAAVAESCNAEDALAASRSAEDRAALMQRLATCVAVHHRHGLMQSDMYLKNFLVTADCVYTLDGDGIRCLPRFGRQRVALDNLAVLLSKFDIAEDGAIPQAYASYSTTLGQSVQNDKRPWLTRRVAWQRSRSVRRYADHKVFRNCTDVEVQLSFRRFCAIVRQPQLPALRACLDNPGDLELRADARYLKRGNTCTVMASRLDGRDMVIKRYNVKNWLHGLSRAWRPSRAAHSWSSAHRLRMYGIEVAQPLAMLEVRWGPLRRAAYFIAQHVAAPDAQTFFRDTQVPDEDKRAAALGAARLLNKLFRLRIVHGDMKASNLLVLPDGHPLLLDLDALYEARCAWLARRGHLRDLRRWMENWQDAPQIAEMMRTALKAVYQNDDILRTAGIV